MENEMTEDRPQEWPESGAEASLEGGSTRGRFLPLPFRGPGWGRMLGEASVIVASILLAFAIDAWWDARQEEKENAEIHQGLMEEFKTHLDFIRVALHRNEQEIQDLAWLIEQTGSEVRPLSPDTLRWALSWAVSSPTIDPAEGTIQGLISSGRLERIHNPELRAGLASWPSVVADIRENEMAIRELVINNLVPALSRKGVFLGSVMSPGVPWPRTEDPEIWAKNIPTVMADAEIRNLISNRYHWAIITTMEYRGAEQTVERLLTLLREETM